MTILKNSAIILTLILTSISFSGYAQDADNDGVLDMSDADSDNDGITDDVECGANTTSLTYTGDINANTIGGYPVSLSEQGNVSAKNSLSTSRTNIHGQATIGTNDVYEGCEIRIKVSDYDDGLIVILDGDTILNFGQDAWGNIPQGAFGAFRSGDLFDSNGGGGWSAWSNEGNGEIIIRDGSLQYMLDINPDPATRVPPWNSMPTWPRMDMLPHLWNNIMPFKLNRTPTLDCENGFDLEVRNVNYGSGNTYLVNLEIETNVFVCVDTDNDGVTDNMDNDSDGDGCADVLEIGHDDSDGDGFLGTSPITVDAQGKVVGHGGYTGTHLDVITIGPDLNNNGIPDACDICTVAPTVLLGNDTILCEGENLVLGANQAGAAYLWQDGSTSSTFNVAVQGEYWVDVTNTCGTTSDTINVSVNSPLTVDLGNDTSLCQGETLTLDATNLNATSYLWQDGSTNPTFNVVQAGEYWVDVTNTCGTTSDTINVSINSPLTVDLGNDTSLCQGETLTLDATNLNATSYLWQNGSTNPTFNVVQAGEYLVEISNVCERVSDTINIDYSPILTVNLGNDTNLCQGEMLTLDATNPNATSYLWQDGSTNPTFNVVQAGEYVVEISDSCGSGFDTINVSLNSLAIIDLGNDTTICLGELLTLNATHPTAISYLWQDNSTNPNFIADEEGTFWVEVSNGCETNSDSVTLSIKDCSCSFYIPNTFTPNFDDDNDEFSPKIDCDIEEYNFVIFNRWGESIFETISPENGWNGNYKGSLVQSGVYVYRIKYKYKGSFNEKLGKVNLLK